MIPAGIIHQKNNFYTARIVGNCGEFSAQELIAIAQIASTYGNGKITATSRGTIEIEQISPDNIESMLAEIIAHIILGTGGSLKILRLLQDTIGSRKRPEDTGILSRKSPNGFVKIVEMLRFKLIPFGV